MNVMSILQDPRRNSANMLPEHAEVIQRNMEQWLGVRFTGRFHFETPAVEARFKSSGERAPSQLRANSGAHFIEKRLVAMYAAENNETILLSGLAYNPDEVIMPVFGTLIDAAGVTLHGKMVKTSMGLVIISDSNAGPWKFLKLSCKPNVQIKENWIENKDENEGVKFTYSCCIVAIKPIAIGETLRIDRNNLWKTKFDYNCNCEVFGCVGNRKRRLLCCLEEGCPKYLHQYSDRTSYREHMKKHEKENTEANDEKVQGKERVLCNECGKDFASRQIMQRHFRAKHRENPKLHSCPHCGAKFTRPAKLKAHIFTSKKGCKAHQEAQKAVPSTELGLRTELSKIPAGRKCDGFKVIETDSAPTPHDQEPGSRHKPALKVKPTTSKLSPSSSKPIKKQSAAPTKRQPKPKRTKPSAEDCQPSTSAAALRSATLATDSLPQTLASSRNPGSEVGVAYTTAFRTTNAKSPKKNWTSFGYI